MRESLLTHWMYEQVESALHVSSIPVGGIYDTIHYQGNTWIKQRWERQIKIDRKNEPSFVVYEKESRPLTQKEITIVIKRLKQIDQAIDELLAEMTQQIQHLCMIYESAYKTTRLKKYKNEVQNLEDIMTSATNEFVLDDQRIILRIVCAEVWQQSDQKEYYLNLMNDN